MIDAVLSYHMNSATCGVAKFNHALAQRLGVELNRMGDSRYRHPLVSVKFSELPDGAMVSSGGTYSLFLHDYHDRGRDVVRGAAIVYAANSVIADAIRPFRPDVIEVWCPSTIAGNPTRGTINVLTFGMAHKIQTARYAKLKTLLDGTGEDYTVSVSTAIHEGSPWDETALVGERLRGIFGDRLRVLGYLADDALARELVSASAVALFFDPALRANNTTFWAACDAKQMVITNLDEHSPSVCAHDIDRMDDWPWRGRAAGILRYDWDRLTDLLSGVPCVR